MNTPISWIKAYVPDLDVTAQEFVFMIVDRLNAEKAPDKVNILLIRILARSLSARFSLWRSIQMRTSL